MNYTYRELLLTLSELSEDELDLTATIYDKSFEAYYPVSGTETTDDDDILDANHPVLIVNELTHDYEEVNNAL